MLDEYDVLAAELALAGEAFPVKHGAAYVVWSPHDAYEGAAALLQVLKDEASDSALETTTLNHG